MKVQESGSMASRAPCRGNETVLLVEDEAALRRMLRQVLTNAGHRVWEAANGAEGLHQWEKAANEIDIVVTDLVIVKEEGVSDAQKRANAAYMNPTPDQTLTMITCWPYGIDDHRLIVIAKPYQSALSTQSEFTLR
jgi:DNA-binding response OmpR family regulator